MYLKRLGIRGFKSFVDTVEINFSPGTNIIIGPNGCGKSNLVDAIRWALGESNVRNLRGLKNEDVIFNGTDSRKALGMAYVEMTLDNGDHILPIDYSEVTVGRKIFRSGESEFYLNKSRVRMRDIADIFSGTGLGKRGYSIIGQGELEQVLNGQPIDRRLILEEASGIIKYRQQRDEVKRRIAGSSNDLLRLGDVVGELRQRKDEIQKKAEKARYYLQISEECRELEKKVLFFELDKAQRSLKQKNEDLILKKRRLEDLTAKIDFWGKKLMQEEEIFAAEYSRKNKLRDQKYTIDSQLNKLQNEILLSKERIKNSEERLETAEADWVKYSSMLEKIKCSLESSIGDYQKEERKYLEGLEECEKLAAEIAEMESFLQARLDLFEKQKVEVFDRTRQLSMTKNEIAEREDRLKKAKDKKERLEMHMQELGNRLETQNKRQAELKEKAREQKQRLDKIKPVLDSLAEQKNNYLKTLQGIGKEYEELSREAVKIKNSLASLQGMRKNLEGYSEGVKSVLEIARRGEIAGILGVMGEIISVPRGVELAVEVAAGKGLENIVTESVDCAREVIQLLKRRNLGRITFLPLDILRAKKMPSYMIRELSLRKGVLGLGSRMVDFKPEFEAAVEYLLGRVLIVEDIETGIKIFKSTDYPLRIVSLEGELINNSGAITGGRRRLHGNTPLQNKRKEKELLKLQQQNQAALRENKIRASDISFQLEKLDRKISALKAKYMEGVFRYDMIVKELDVIDIDVSSGEEKKNQVLNEISRLGEVLQVLEKEIGDLRLVKVSAEAENELVSNELGAIEKEIRVITQRHEVGKERLTAFRAQVRMKERELEKIKKSISQFEQVKNSYEQSKQEMGELKERLQREIDIELNKIKSMSSIIEEKKKELQEITDKIAEIELHEELYQKNISAIRCQIEPLREQKAELGINIKNIEISIARAEAELGGLKSKWQEKFKIPWEEAGAEASPVSQIRYYKNRIEVLKKNIAELGPVDMDSIREYDEIAEKFEFMQRQYNDLSAARDSLDALLRETEKIMLEKFHAFLLQVNESFKRTFTEIFDGGEAQLKLETQDNPLEAGVEIEVKIPGKKIQALSLLSGGERALTCIAFIFSLLRLKPTPFCLFDEIDASLDETNLIRFSDFIKSMAHRMQFIVVTHRQSAIEAGENIYGITMPEKGISSVIAINISEAKSLAG